MPTFFQRPENALKRAKEFIAVEKKQQALDALYDVIKSKKHRTWQKIHEPIMEQYLELCVELKKSHIAKEGLYQYKNICQQINIRSLEEVVRKYLAMAEEKTEAARQESQQLGNKALIDVDDLDVIATPENLLLSAVSGEDTQDRTDRAILTPWVKFLWESYRQCLDLLRNNNSVEKLYQDIAQHAFKFCLKYQRKTEFRKLCENLRGHLGHVHKHQHQQRAINLNNPESQAMHLETRLAQLDSAIQMELWQEAFKAVEDIHGLIILAKKHPKPALMANYYQKLGLVFWKSGNHLFHAAAWHRLFVLSREQRKNLSPEELQRLSSRVLCATLAIPIAPSRTQIDQVLEMDDNTMEKQRRLATLLMLNSPPTRAQLVKDLVKLNIIQHVHPELQNLYRWLEVEFHPLKLSARMATSIEFLQGKEELLQYVPALQDITVARLIKQVSQVYQTIEFARLAALAPFTDRFHLERVIVDAAKKLDLQVRIDHRTRSLSFGTDLAMSQKEDLPEGPYLQSMPSEMIRNQLVHMAQALHKSVRIITPEDIEAKREELRAHISNCYRQTARKEHQNVLMRRHIIEERKEELENLNEAKERQEQDQLKEQQRAQYEAEMARLEREAEERERQRRLDEERDIQRKATKEKLEQIRQTPLGAKIFADMDEEVLEELDMDQILQKQIQHLEKEKKEMQEKLRQQEKKVDYFERAKRVEELPLLKKQFDEESVQAKEFWEQQEKERISLLAEEREVALAHRDRLIHMRPDKDRFINRLKEARMSVYKDKLKDFEKRLTEERKKRLAERKEKRKEERKQKWIQEKEEEEQRRRDEEVKKQREEQERLEREAIEEQERLEHERREIEKAEYAEKLRKLDEMAQKKRQRELELEETERARQVDGADMDQGGWRGRGARDEAEPKAWRPPAREGAGWREREKEREDSWRKKDDAPSRAAPERSGWRDRQPEAPAGDSWRDQQAEPSGPSEEEPPRARFSDRFASRDVRLDKNYSAEVERYKRDREEVRERDMSDRGFSRGGRDFGDGGRDFGDRGGRDFGDRGGRDFGGRDFGDRGGRDFGDRGGRDFGGRDFDRNRGGRDFGDRDRGGRDFGDRGGRDFGDRDRGGRGFGDRDRGGRDFGDRGSRDFGDRDRRGFGGGRDFGDRDRGGGRDFDRGPRRDFGDRDQGPRGGGREDGGSWRRGGDRGGESEDKWRSQRVSKPSPTKASTPQGEDGGDDDGWTTVRH